MLEVYANMTPVRSMRRPDEAFRRWKVNGGSPAIGPMELASLVLSLLALAVATTAALRIRKLAFCPEVVAGDVILPRAGSAGRVRLLLPLHFSNAGNAGGIVEWVALRLTPQGDAD